MEKFTFTFDSVPRSLEALQALPEANLGSPYKTAALSLLVLCNYKNDVETTHAMVDYLRGPEPMSVMEKQFLRDRLRGKEYKTFSFFEGAKNTNDYTPLLPYKITVYENPYSFTNENYATLYVQSGGADSQRPIKLRKKPSTGQWFLNDILCLSDIRIPQSTDPWA